MSKKFGPYFSPRLRRYREQVMTALLKKGSSMTALGELVAFKESHMTPQKVYFILNGYVKGWEQYRDDFKRALKQL